jgi:hypothetical protein
MRDLGLGSQTYMVNMYIGREFGLAGSLVLSPWSPLEVVVRFKIGYLNKGDLFFFFSTARAQDSIYFYTVRQGQNAITFTG